MSHHHRRASAISAPDPYFQDTVLLLTGNGTNGGQNNTFLDDSSNNFTITRFGNTTQGSFSPFGWQWSNYFDGTGDFLTVADNANLRPGTSSFTLEAWVYRNASGSAHTIYSKGSSTGPTGFVFQITSTNVLRFTDTSTNIDSTGTILAGVWTHVALVREGTGTNQTKLYINGTQDGQGTSATDFTQTDQVKIGRDRGTTAEFNGYISNLRFLKNTAQYTTTFTPPTTPLTAINNTQLLTCQSNRFIDNSSNAFAITRNGDVRVSNFAPFPAGEYAASVEGGSGYFDGAGDYLEHPSSTNINFGTGDFTVEFWVYFITLSAHVSIIDHRAANTVGSNILLQAGPTGTLLLHVNGSNRILSSAGTVSAGSWNHIALTRSGTSTKIFANGTQAGSTYTDTTNYTTVRPRIGQGNYTSFPENLNGYISSLRLLKGTAQYTSNFTPSTTPLTAITNTQLLLNFTNGSIVDATGKNNLETIGNAQVSTSVKKYGTGSMAFDGTGDWLTVRDTADMRLGTGNFTIEFWLYLAATGSARGCVGKGTASTGWLFSTNTSNQVVFTFGSSTITSTGALSGSTWYHISVVREGTGTNQTKIYIDGANDGTGTVSTDFTQTNLMYIGADRTGGSAMNGNIDDLRITKAARYTANFTPPYRQLPTR